MTTDTKVTPTPGPWTAYRMVHAETGELLTPEQVGEYTCNSVKKSAGESGSLEFLFITAEKPDGPADVCLVGNGPTSPANARLIAASPDLYHALKLMLESHDATCPGEACGIGGIDFARAALAKAEGR